MARKAQFAVKKITRPDGSVSWMVSIPPAYSDTGKYRRRFFGTRDEARAESDRLQSVAAGLRDRASNIRASLAEDATAAAAILEPFGVTLKQAAEFFAVHHDKRSKAPTLGDAWDLHPERPRQNQNQKQKTLRPRTLSDFRAWRSSLEKAAPDLLETNVRDITPEAIRKALDGITSGPTRWNVGLRNISAVLSGCVKDRTLDENPARRVPQKGIDEADDVSVYTPSELSKLLAACRDYPLTETGGRDRNADRLCSGCLAPFAIMAFAGIRPDEVTRLRWSDISLELRNIRIRASVAKKARRRNVPVNDTLAAWLETVLPDHREGKIAPTRWRFKAARVRREAGFCGREKQDALRHSYGSYSLALHNDMDELKAAMGHEHVRVYYDHYHKAVTKAEALKYFAVLPAGAGVQVLAAV